MDKKIEYPSQEHHKYIKALETFCLSNKIGMLLHGSVSRNEATLYSDIDLILVRENLEDFVEDLLRIHEEPVMINFTVNPEGIAIVIFESGLCIDLDLRTKVSEEELVIGVEMTPMQRNWITNSEIQRCDIKGDLVTEISEWYLNLRLLHRSLIKRLSGKEKSSVLLLDELKCYLSDLDIDGTNFTNDYEEDVLLVWKVFCVNFSIGEPLKRMFESLMLKVRSSGV